MSSGESVPSFYPMWANERLVSILGMVCCGVLIFFSFFIFIPISVTMSQTGGNCFLYADTYGYGAASVCQFTIACSVILLILCAARLGLYAYKFFKMKENQIVNKLSSWFSLFGVHMIIALVDAFLLFLLLVTACLVSVGTAHLCNSVFGSRSKCSDNVGVILPDERVNKSFYTALSIAEGAVWFIFVLWLLVVIFEFFVAWKKETFQPIVSKFKGRVSSSAV